MTKFDRSNYSPMSDAEWAEFQRTGVVPPGVVTRVSILSMDSLADLATLTDRVLYDSKPTPVADATQVLADRAAAAHDHATASLNAWRGNGPSRHALGDGQPTPPTARTTTTDAATTQRLADAAEDAYQRGVRGLNAWRDKA